MAPTRANKEERLWAAYRQKPSRSNRNKLAVFYLPLTFQIAHVVDGTLSRGATFNARFDVPELASYGAFGLMDAISKFDSVQESTSFVGYAYGRIHGSIIDEVRRVSWQSRDQYQDARKVSRARDILGERGVEPTDAALAVLMEISVVKVRKMLTAAAVAATPVTMETPVGGSDSALTLGDVFRSPVDGPASAAVKASMHDQMMDAIEGLTPKEAMVIQMHTFDEIPYWQIGEQMHLSESRICQIHGKAVAHLQQIIKEGDQIASDQQQSA